MTPGTWHSTRGLRVLGSGQALPGPPVSTESLILMMVQRFGFTRSREARVIAKRMRIGHRHICRDFAARNERPRPQAGNPDLASEAVAAALADAGLAVEEIGYLIGHTATPDQPLPPNTAVVADRIGYQGPYLELRQACTGFANALMIAHGLLADRNSRPVVIVGSETGSLFFDPCRMHEDPGQVINMLQMGDGAGALVLGPDVGASGARIADCWFGCLGLDRKPGIQMRQASCEFDHDFQAIATQGRVLFEAGLAAAASAGVNLEEIDFLLPHQTSGRIAEQVAAHIHMPRGRVFVNADQIGNTGSAAILIALAQLRTQWLAPEQTVLALGAEASKFMFGGFKYVHH